MKRVLTFDNVYINTTATVSGPKEYEGPLGNYFDFHYKDLRLNQKSFEKAEILMQHEAIVIALKKLGLQANDIGASFGGDLINQEIITNYTLRDFDMPFIGLYGACSTSVLSILVSALYLEKCGENYALAFTSSHNSTSERQFRNPTEYGGAKVPTTTSTVTGCGVAILSKNKSNISLTKGLFGKVIDMDFKNMMDMGRAMAPAACESLIEFFTETNTTPADYDLILTGDLSTYGKDIVKQILIDQYGTCGNYEDCGLLIYDLEKQDVFAGGSGCACCALVTYGYILNQIEKGVYNKVLVAATGALMNTMSCLQKESIPAISHVMLLERV